MRIRRTFTREFKGQSAEAIISGQVSPLDLSRKYGISPAIISRWKKEYLEGRFFENNDPDYASLEIRVKELERLVGKLTMENNTLKVIRPCFSNFRRRLREAMSLSLPLPSLKFYKTHSSFERRVRPQDEFVLISCLTNSISLAAIFRPWITVVLFMLI